MLNVRPHMLRRTAARIIGAGLALLAFRTRSASASEALQDAEAISELRRAGSDLTKPQTVAFYVYAYTRAAASSVAEALGKRGYAVTVRPAAIGNMPWLILATRSMLVSVESIGRSARLIREEVSRHGGEYDGWEAGVSE